MLFAVGSILALTYVATTSGDTGAAGEAPASTIATHVGEPVFLAMRRAQTAADLAFPTDSAASQAVAEGQLVASSARRVLQGANGGGAWLMPAASGDLCFVSIDATGVTTTVCVPEAWAVSHGGLGVIGSTESGHGSPTSTVLQGVLPDGSHGISVTARNGETVPVNLNADNAYYVVVPGTPQQMTYLDQSGVQQKQEYPAATALG